MASQLRTTASSLADAVLHEVSVPSPKAPAAADASARMSGANADEMEDIPITFEGTDPRTPPPTVTTESAPVPKAKEGRLRLFGIAFGILAFVIGAVRLSGSDPAAQSTRPAVEPAAAAAVEPPAPETPLREFARADAAVMQSRQPE
jgi:hypothetical protein